jgi:hypothetical protein
MLLPAASEQASKAQRNEINSCKLFLIFHSWRLTVQPLRTTDTVQRSVNNVAGVCHNEEAQLLISLFYSLYFEKYALQSR